MNPKLAAELRKTGHELKWKLIYLAMLLVVLAIILPLSYWVLNHVFQNIAAGNLSAH